MYLSKRNKQIKGCKMITFEFYKNCYKHSYQSAFNAMVNCEGNKVMKVKDGSFVKFIN